MNVKTKFGLGEIVHKCLLGTGEAQHDDFLEVRAITIEKSHDISYLCLYPNGRQIWFNENELQGDPDFDQEVGYNKEKIA